MNSRTAVSGVGTGVELFRRWGGCTAPGGMCPSNSALGRSASSSAIYEGTTGIGMGGGDCAGGRAKFLGSTSSYSSPRETSRSFSRADDIWDAIAAMFLLSMRYSSWRYMSGEATCC